MSRFFDSDNIFWKTVGSVVDICGLSLLWLALCLPIVTIGSATCGLYYSVVTCVRPQEPGAFRAFFHSFKMNLKQGIITTLIVLGVAALCIVGWRACYSMGNEQGWGSPVLAAYSILLLVPCGILQYLFPLLARFEYELGPLFRTAVALSFAHLLWTLLLVLIIGVSAWLTWAFTIPGFFMPGTAALLNSFVLEKLFRRYSPELVARDEADRQLRAERMEEAARLEAEAEEEEEDAQ